jgi:hypothetical protein
MAIEFITLIDRMDDNENLPEFEVRVNAHVYLDREAYGRYYYVEIESMECVDKSILPLIGGEFVPTKKELDNIEYQAIEEFNEHSDYDYDDCDPDYL